MARKKDFYQTEEGKKYQRAYYRKYASYTIRFNPNNEQDEECLRILEGVSNKRGYIKKLILIDQGKSDTEPEK